MELRIVHLALRKVQQSCVAVGDMGPSLGVAGSEHVDCGLEVLYWYHGLLSLV